MGNTRGFVHWTDPKGPKRSSNIQNFSLKLLVGMMPLHVLFVGATKRIREEGANAYMKEWRENLV